MQTTTVSENEILNLASKLSPTKKAWLIDRLYDTFSDYFSVENKNKEIERAWEKEIVKRIDAYEKGESKTYSMKEVFAEIEKV